MEPTQNKRTLAGGVALGAALALILLTFFHVYYIGRSGDGGPEMAICFGTSRKHIYPRLFFPMLYFTLPPL
jgi:hypothetical protein